MRARLAALLLCLGTAWVAQPAAAPEGTLKDGLAALRGHDYARAHTLMQALSKAGDPRATFYLSLIYGKGLGVEPDQAKSLFYLKQAAEAGDPLAQYNLGNQYNRDGPLGFHPGLAASWWKKAANQGLALAQHNLGSLYALGRGVDQDFERARYWFEKARDNGSPRSAEALAALERMQRQTGTRAGQDGAARITQVNRVWLKGQPAGAFTLQLGAYQDDTEARRVAGAHAWKRPLLLYRISAPGGPVWGLGYGVFEAAGAARRARAELPAGLAGSHPWPHALADIGDRLVD